MECDAIRLKIKLIHTKKEERLVINNLSVDYKNKRVALTGYTDEQKIITTMVTKFVELACL